MSPLFGRLIWVKADAADLVALFLHRDVELLHRIALALVVAGGVRLGLLLRGVVERFTDDDPA